MTAFAKPLAAAFAALALALSSGAGVFMLSVEPGIPTSKHTNGKTHSSGGRYNRNRTHNETTSKSATYRGRVTYTGSDSRSVRLEAYFVTRGVGDGVHPERIGGRKDIGTFKFGPKSKGMQEFQVDSPTVKQTTKTSQRNKGRGGRYGRQRQTKKTSSGEQLLGVIVRGIDDNGNVACVKALPSKSTWEKAARMPNVPSTPPKL